MELKTFQIAHMAAKPVSQSLASCHLAVSLKTSPKSLLATYYKCVLGTLKEAINLLLRL